jgi:hypothetical protein
VPLHARAAEMAKSRPAFLGCCARWRGLESGACWFARLRIFWFRKRLSRRGIEELDGRKQSADDSLYVLPAL